MSGKTNELINLSKSISDKFDNGKWTSLSSGNKLLALLAGALLNLKLKAKSWLNWQIPIITEGEHSNAG